MWTARNTSVSGVELTIGKKALYSMQQAVIVCERQVRKNRGLPARNRGSGSVVALGRSQ